MLEIQVKDPDDASKTKTINFDLSKQRSADLGAYAHKLRDGGSLREAKHLQAAGKPGAGAGGEPGAASSSSTGGAGPGAVGAPASGPGEKKPIYVNTKKTLQGSMVAFTSEEQSKRGFDKEGTAAKANIKAQDEKASKGAEVL